MPSSVIRRFAYDLSRRSLEIEFVGGRRYRYYGVPPGIAGRLGSAVSKGRFFNSRIRDDYPCEELTDDEAGAWALVPGGI